jgi:sugar/nucleoside kinase (ribokinase family)
VSRFVIIVTLFLNIVYPIKFKVKLIFYVIRQYSEVTIYTSFHPGDCARTAAPLWYNLAMLPINSLEPVDYLVIGHLTVDLTPEGSRLGGTAAYASLTAQSLGLRVGVITSWGSELSLAPMHGIPVASFPAEHSTTFENIYTPSGRIQYIRAVAPRLDYYHVPEPWRQAGIVHLGPVAQEVEPSLVRNFPGSLLGVTPQGWLRAWDGDGRVRATEWPEASFVLERAGAAVISVEDVEGDEERIEEMAASCHILAVTEAHLGARLFWNGDVRRFRPSQVEEVDATGAGDVFAAAFFYRLKSTYDPWEAARFATLVGAASVTRPGLEGIPTPEEIEACRVEVF